MVDIITDNSLDEASKAILISSKGEAVETTPRPRPEGDDNVAPDDDETGPATEETPKEGEESDDEEGGSEETDGEGSEDDDIDEVAIDVVVDGETRSVKLKDLKARYSGEAAIESRLQEATETKAKAYQVGDALYKTLNAQAERLRALDAILQEQAKPPVDWEELRVKDPGRYLLERDKAREMDERRSRVAYESQRVQQQQDQLNSLAIQEYTAKQAREFANKVPEITDPAKAKEIMGNVADAASYYGLSQQDIENVVDHRHLMILVDAAKYRKMMAGKSGKAQEDKIKQLSVRPLLKASSASAPNKMSGQKKQELATLKRAKATGSIDDVAKLLMVRKSR
jgi:hypothetical protein